MQLSDFPNVKTIYKGTRGALMPGSVYRIVKTLIQLFVACFFVTYQECSVQLTGGGSEGEAKVIGTVIGTDNKPALNTQVTLVPEKYNPLKDSAIQDSAIDTTDANGMFEFTVTQPGVYNVESVHLSQRTKSIQCGIVVDIQNKMTPVRADTLKKTGAVKIFLPDSVDTVNGYVYIEGTTMYTCLTGAMQVNGGRSIVIDSVFAAIIPPIYLDRIVSNSTASKLSGSVEVFSNDTTIIDSMSVDYLHYTTANSGLPENKVVDLTICSGEFQWFADSLTFWFSTYSSGIAVFNKSAWKIYDSSTTPLIFSETVRQIRRYGQKDYLWIVFDKGLVKFDGATWELWSTSTGAPANNVTCISLDSKGNIWSGVNNGICFFEITGVEPPGLYTSSAGSYSLQVEGVVVDKSDIPWFATGIGALTYINSGYKTFTTATSAIFDNSVFSTAVDSNNVKWFGHNGGISRFDDNQWSTFSALDSRILAGKVYAIVPDKNNNIWVGTETGLTMYDGKTWKDFNGGIYSFLDNMIIRDIDFDATGTLWLCTENSGVFAFRPAIK